MIRRHVPALLAGALAFVAMPVVADKHGHGTHGHGTHGHGAASAHDMPMPHGPDSGHGSAATGAAPEMHGQHDHAAHGHETGDSMHGGHDGMAKRPDELDLARTRPSVGGHFRVTVAPREEPLRINHLHAWTVRVTDADGQPVEGATLRVDGGMPEHGHGLPTAPQVTRYLGDGTYLLEGVRFSMQGWWNLDLLIEAGAVKDMAAFDLVIE